MVHFLMRDLTVVLQDVVGVQLHGLGQSLGNWHGIGEEFVRDVVQFGTVVLGDD